MKISIITVCKNSEKTIERTIRSVLNQNYKDLEYIIVDGKSTDRTLEIINKYQNEIAVIISESDAGLYDAMNKGIAHATGQIIGIINSDDWYEPNIFPLVAECFQQTDAEVIYGKMRVVTENEEVVRIWENAEKELEHLRYKMVIPHPTVFVKNEIYKKHGVFSLAYEIIADYDLMLRLYLKRVRFVYLEEILANFQLGGISQKKNTKRIIEKAELIQSYLGEAPDNMKELIVKEILFSRSLAYFYKAMSGDVYELIQNIVRKKSEHISTEDIAIWGTGKWGRLMYHALNEQSIRPAFWVDNDSIKWGESVEGIKVLSPDSIRDFRGIVLIMVKDYSEEILLQIGKLESCSNVCITWEEVAEEYMCCSVEENIF